MSATAQQLRQRLGSLSRGAYHPTPRPPVEHRLPAGFETVATPLGEAWKRSEVVPAGRERGRDPELRYGYLDLETTGLSGGTGTYAFAAALARRTDAGVELVQFFLPEPAREPGFLHALAEEIARCPAIATYNGSRFDLPLLRTRWVMARMGGDFEHPPHVDLLSLTRALFGQRLASCALRNVEERVLGFEREEDVSGALLPNAYFEYIRRGWSPLLEAALEHNRQDVESLHHLHLRLESRLHGEDVHMEALDWLALGRHLGKKGRRAAGWRALRQAAEMAQDEASATAALLLAKRLTGKGRAASAERLLAWIDERVTAQAALAVARARLLEWRLRDPAAALDVVERALEGSAPVGRLADDLFRRRSRLSRRVVRSRQPDRDGAFVDEDPEDFDQVRVERALQLSLDPGQSL